MIKKLGLLTVGLSLVALFVGCQKEKIGRLMISAEGMDGTRKMYVSGLSSYWEDGDKININGVESTITVNGSSAYVDGEFSAENYCIVFPSSILQSRAGSTASINMPATYIYKTTVEGNQILNAPLAYYGDATGGSVVLRHLTGALNVNISGPTGLEIDRITVSTVQNLVLSGAMQFDLSDIDAFTSNITNNSENNTITMLGGKLGTVQIPIPVLSGNVRFKIKVEGHLEGTKYTFERTQTSGGHIGRAEAATVEINMNEDQEDVTTSALFPSFISGGITYYTISTPQDVVLMSEAIYGTWWRDDDHDLCSREWTYGGLKYRNANYRITKDIDMTGVDFRSLWHFTGIIDGGGNTISNLVVSENTNSDDVNRDQVGLLTEPSGAAVRNLNINNLTVNITIEGDVLGNYVGAIAGVSSSVTISNVHITGFKPGGVAYTLNGILHSHDYYSRRVVIGGFIGSCNSTSNSIVNSSVSFASGIALAGGACSYQASNFNSIGGLVGRGTCSASNVTVDMNNFSLGLYDPVYNTNTSSLAGGLFGDIQTASIPEANVFNNVTILGNITVTGNTGRVHTGKIYNYYYGGTYYSSLDELEGVNVSGLTINGI